MPNLRHVLPVHFLALLCGALPACSGGGGGGGGGGKNQASGVPATPATGTLSLDLSISGGGLDLDAPGGVTEAGTVSTAGGNYLLASADIQAVNAAIATPLALPVTLLRAADSQTAALSGTNTYVRSYEVTADSVDWTVNLQSVATDASTTAWSLRVTTKQPDLNGCCQNFELMSGTSTSTSGTWQVQDVAQPQQHFKLFDVDYALTPSGKTLTYTINDDLPAAERLGGGSVVKYTVANGSNGASSVATLDIQDSAAQSEHVISWDLSTKAGSEVIGGTTRACWGTAAAGYPDVGCP